MIREDPPDDARRQSFPWVKEANRLRDDPGIWYAIAEYPAPGLNSKWDKAGAIAYDINTGRLMAFRPKGSFEALSRKAELDPHDGSILTRKVYARYVGEYGEYGEG